MFWKATDAEKATGGKSLAPWQANRAEIDSRAIKGGEIFFALKGENVDGHKYVKSALEKGASAAVVSEIPKGLERAPLLVVDDVEKALWDLAHFNRARARGKLIGITGSVGKTGTKEALKLLLSAQGTTYATEGNYNNHLGVPLSLCRFDPASDFGIFEMGMNHANEIRPLTKLVQPHAIIITNVEAVHLEFFNSVAEIADAKSEIMEGLLPEGIAILPADSAHKDRLLAHAKKSGVKMITLFGASPDADFGLMEIQEKNDGQEITANIRGTKLSYFMPFIGRHIALNSLAVLAGIEALEANIQKAALTYKQYTPAEGRGSSYYIDWEGIRFTLIDDSYNASPASMRASFAVLKSKAKNGRTIAALGEMRELGKDSVQFHKDLADGLKDIDLVLTAAGNMQHLNAALSPAQRGPHLEKAEDLLPALKSVLKTGDTLLVKGSHGSHIYKIAEKLKTYALSPARSAS
jgi:UDP-N-acetylmuramoyl-tripeptide--D-alanyl-D-alanine ligase